MSPRDFIFLVGHSRLKPRSVFLMLYTSSAYSTRTPSAVNHMPSRNFMMRRGRRVFRGWLCSQTELGIVFTPEQACYKNKDERSALPSSLKGICEST